MANCGGRQYKASNVSSTHRSKAAAHRTGRGGGTPSQPATTAHPATNPGLTVAERDMAAENTE
ncbi:hypothetical protein ACIBCN_09090 [Nocardia sp. NPDC051052]|uniref:hypothetical protein n=1 Tax=Nocardia sp. NPDC051052 TaxID=3364322 RepID=UPI00378BDABF